MRFKETSDLQECGTKRLAPKLSYNTLEKFLKAAEGRKPFLSSYVYGSIDASMVSALSLRCTFVESECAPIL